MHVEICIRDGSPVSPQEMKEVLNSKAISSPEVFLQQQINPEHLSLPSPMYTCSIESIRKDGNSLPIHIHCYTLNAEGPAEDYVITEDEKLSIANQSVLPCKHFDQLWESIIFEEDGRDIKEILLKFMETLIMFSDHDVNQTIVACNKIILLYGPPGTGKTTLCHGLAQKLAIRYNHLYESAILLEVNTHSLFSKWFAESGKMVKKLFDRVNEIADDEKTLVFLLIDEVESIATARQSAMNGSDPSDAIRVVNALLTQIDQLTYRKNVVLMATSNLTESIDLAFLSRADIKQYIAPPSRKARYIILRTCIDELMSKSILSPEYDLIEYDKITFFDSTSLQQFPNTISLLEIADLTEGLSGRVLRKLSFLAFTNMDEQQPCPVTSFFKGLREAVKQQELVQ